MKYDMLSHLSKPEDLSLDWLGIQPPVHPTPIGEGVTGGGWLAPTPAVQSTRRIVPAASV